jgi:hypothetical protein
MPVSAQNSQLNGQPRVASNPSGNTCLRASVSNRGTGTLSAE